jgi:hypothetical protein
MAIAKREARPGTLALLADNQPWNAPAIRTGPSAAAAGRLRPADDFDLFRRKSASVQSNLSTDGRITFRVVPLQY